MQSSRQRVLDAINHRQPEKMAVDFGGMNSTGIHCSIIAGLREYYGLEKRPVKVHDPFQMVGWMDSDLLDVLGADVAMVMPASTTFGNALGEWKEWKAPWGQEILIPKGMETDRQEDGSYVAYPQGDRSVPPCAKLPEGGYFFDALDRQEPYDEDNPDPADNAADFGVLPDETVKTIAENAMDARATGRAVMFTLPGGSLGSPSMFYGMGMKRTKGMRRLADWYMALVAFPEFVKEVFNIQTSLAIKNLEKINKAAGEYIDILMLCTGDYGTQISQFFSKAVFEDIFCPYHKRMTDWIHGHTGWKVFKHCCGAVEPFIDGMIEAGIDILNPVQCSASGMEPEHLKKTYGGRIVFWGGGVDTQKTLPFGTPAEVREQVFQRCRIFAPGGGFVFNTIHNTQAKTPVENFVAMIDAVKEYNRG